MNDALLVNIVDGFRGLGHERPRNTPYLVPGTCKEIHSIRIFFGTISLGCTNPVSWGALSLLNPPPYRFLAYELHILQTLA
jgi:hypothetical protein